MEEEPQSDPQPPPPPHPPILDYRGPDEERPIRFKKAMRQGAGGFGLSLLILLFFILFAVATNGLCAVLGLIVSGGVAIYAAARSRQTTGTFGFVAGYFLTMGIVMLVLGGGCFLLVFGARF